MPRNIERDEKEAMRRKEQLMEAGFRLFSQYGIENVLIENLRQCLADDLTVLGIYQTG